MEALIAHAKNLDKVLEATTDDSKVSPDGVSALMENFSWLELGLFFVNVMLYLSSLENMKSQILPENTFFSFESAELNTNVFYTANGVI